MNTVLVLGAGGMAGHVVATSLREAGHEVDTLSARNQLDDKTKLVDVQNRDELTRVLAAKEYDIIVNCIGLLVKQSEDRKDLAVYLNAFLPHFLETYYQASKTRIIHLSTDCVFSGKNAPYSEDSAYDGEIFYDRSKALGELRNEKDLTFRMSIIGPDMQEEGTGLYNWFSKQSGVIFGYTKAMWNGVTTIELAKAINAAIDQGLTGLYHLVPSDGSNISKYALLELFKSTFERDDIIIEPKDDVVVDKTLINTRKDFNFLVPDYPTMASEMKSWIANHKQLYKHYLGDSNVGN